MAVCAAWFIAHRSHAEPCLEMCPCRTFRSEPRTVGVSPAQEASLRALGQLAASGPFLDDWGALIIYEAGTAEEAEALLKADPFHDSKIFVRWTIRPWNPVWVNRELFPAS